MERVAVTTEEDRHSEWLISASGTISIYVLRHMLGGGGGGGETDCLWTCPSATTSIPNHSCNDSHNDNGNDNHNDNHIIFIRMSRTYNFNRYCTCRGEYNVLYLFKKICNAWYNLSQPKF